MANSSTSNPQHSVKLSPAFLGSIVKNVAGTAINIAGLQPRALVLRESLVPILTDVLSTPTDMHMLHGFEN